ncbi:MAG: heme NO-binding domain-containing protein [Nitrospiria bacterium]
MHGIIFSELRKYVDNRLGKDGWEKLMKEAGMPKSKMYLAIEEYADGEAVALVTAAAKITGKSAQAILEDFGEFIAPDLVRMYASLIDSSWNTLDLIEHTERTMHTVVRIKNKGAKPPELQVSRPGKDEVVITYSSPRKMCSVAKGIAKGIAKHYNERVAVTESSCMLQGRGSCKISVKLAA